MYAKPQTYTQNYNAISEQFIGYHWNTKMAILTHLIHVALDLVSVP